MGNKIYFRTTITIVLLVIIMLSIHFFNLLNIQEVSFTDDWSEDFKIGETTDRDFKLSSLRNNLLNLNAKTPNILNFNIIDKDGNVKEKGTTKISNFEFKKVNQSYLIEDKYIYLYEGNVYLSKFESNRFLDPIKIIEDVKYLTVKDIDRNVYITTTNDKEIRVSDIKNEKIENLYEKDNTENVKYAYYFTSKEDDYLVAIENKGRESELLTLSFLNDNNENIILEDVNKYSGYSIKDINIDNLDKKISISYILRMNKQGIRSYEMKNIQIDKSNLKVQKNEYSLRNYNVDNLDSDIETYVKDNKQHIVASGDNLKNEFSSEKNDIFDMTLKDNGEIEDITFISTTDKYSSEIEISSIDKNKYIVFSEVESGRYNLRIFSNSETMMGRERVTREDYISVILKVIVIPLISIMYSVIRGLILLFFMAVPLAIVYFTYFNKGYSKDKIKIALIIGIYIITNIIAFKFIYFTKGNEVYYSTLFYSKYFRIIGPIITNLLTAIATFIFYREVKIKNLDLSFIAYPVFFIVIDVFLNNILYVPFLSLFKLFGF